MPLKEYKMALVLRGQTIDGPDVDDLEAMDKYRERFSNVGFSKHLKICQWESLTIKYNSSLINL